MKRCSRCKIEKSIDQFHRRANRPGGVTPHCKSCKKDMAAEYRAKKLAAVRARSIEYYHRHEGEMRQRARAWHRDNPVRSKALARMWRARTVDRRRALLKAWMASHREHRRRYRNESYRSNPLPAILAANRRRALRLQAVPSWADPTAIREIYRAARARSRAEQVRYEVDHIVPLRSPLVCGLHVTANLAILPASVNSLKSNRWWPDKAAELPAG